MTERFHLRSLWQQIEQHERAVGRFMVVSNRMWFGIPPQKGHPFTLGGAEGRHYLKWLDAGNTGSPLDMRSQCASSLERAQLFLDPELASLLPHVAEEREPLPTRDTAARLVRTLMNALEQAMSLENEEPTAEALAIRANSLRRRYALTAEEIAEATKSAS